jgi:predicted ester cyclase
MPTFLRGPWDVLLAHTTVLLAAAADGLQAAQAGAGDAAAAELAALERLVLRGALGRAEQAYRSAEQAYLAGGRSLLDVLDAIRQMGFWPLPPSLGQEGMWPGPLAGDGLLFSAQDAAVSAASLQLTLGMQASLGAHDDTLGGGREGLLTMPQKHFWHPKMMWYGPCGIGTTRGLQGFVDYHKLPFRIAFPNRRGGNHYVRIGDGAYSATAGWPSVHARHLGGDFCGVGPTGRDVTMRVMDFYLHHEGLIRENWVPIDMIHLLKQMDVDVFARMQSFFRRGRIGAS